MPTPKRRATNQTGLGELRPQTPSTVGWARTPLHLCVCALPLPEVGRLLPGPCQRVDGRTPLSVDSRTWGTGTCGAQGFPRRSLWLLFSPEKPQGMLANVGLVYQYSTASELALGLTDV